MPKFIPQYAFGRGEVSPAFYGRADLQQMTVALKRAENVNVLRSGGLVNRSGTKFIGEIKNSASKARLIPFSYNTEQSYALEFGNQYMRVVKDGGYVVLSATPTAWSSATAYAVGGHVSNGGVNYYCKTAHTSGTFATDLSAGKWYALTGLIVEIPTPYAVADLGLLKFVQSADVLTITHSSYAQRELSRLSHYKWVLEDISYSPTVSAPTGLSGTASVAGGGTLSSPDSYSSAYYYCVTTVDEDGNESLPTTAVGVLSKTFGYATNASYPYIYPKITLSWTVAAGTYQNNVYRRYQGLYALVGTTDTTSGTVTFFDENITPDPTQGIPVQQDPFATDGYPQCATYYEQRIVFGGLSSSVQEIALSQVGNYHNFYKSEPLKDGDGFTRKLAARKVSEVRHLIAIRELVAFTSGSIWKLGSGGQSDVITPSSLNAKQQVEIGCSHVPPIVVGDRILFVQDMGCVVRDIGYDFSRDNYSGDEISLFSAHMLEGKEIAEWAYAAIPNSTIYVVRNDGVMLCFTYLKEQEMIAWTRYATDGEFESVVSIPEGSEDAVYCIVKRTIDGATKRYVERFESRLVIDSGDGLFVDCGLTYSGSPVTTLTGLDHLEGETVAVVGDGAVYPNKTVSGGSITISPAASEIKVGLPYESTIETLPIGDAQGGMGQRKKTVRVRMRVSNSAGIWVGSSEDMLTEKKRHSWDTSLYTGEVEIGVIPAFDESATLIVKQKDPLPLTILSLMPEVES